MKNICIDARMIQSSGIGTYLRNLVPHVAKAFEEVYLIGSKPEIASIWPSLEEAKIIETKIPIYSLAEQINLPRKVPVCDFFWSPHYNAPLLPIPAQKRIVTIHDVFHLAFQKELSTLKRFYAKFMIGQTVRKASKIITVSEFSKTEIIKYTQVDASKIEVIPNGVNLLDFKVIEDTTWLTQVEQKYQLPSSFILYVGNVKPHKNLKNLVLAFQEFLKKDTTHHLVIVGKKEGFITGDPELFKLIEQDVTLNDKVHFTGYVAQEDLSAIYNLATLFVFPSLYEGFGLPPLEAMACGCPIICSKAASMPEICGDAVYYIDPLEVNELTEGISVLLQNKELSESFIKKGQAQAKKFTWEKSWNKHIEILKN